MHAMKMFCGAKENLHKHLRALAIAPGRRSSLCIFNYPATGNSGVPCSSPLYGNAKSRLELQLCCHTPSLVTHPQPLLPLYCCFF